MGISGYIMKAPQNTDVLYERVVLILGEMFPFILPHDGPQLKRKAQESMFLFPFSSRITNSDSLPFKDFQSCLKE